jgi:RNA polymerase sigma-70 factor (ECF subfamily)
MIPARDQKAKVELAIGRRVSTSRRLSRDSERTTQPISGLIPAWRQGDPAAVAELTPLLTRQLTRQLRRLLDAPSNAGAGVDASAVVEETLLSLARESGCSWPHRPHLMAAAAPVLRGALLREARGLTAPVPVSSALFEGRPGSWDLLRMDAALGLLARQDPRQGRIVELRLFGGLSTAEVAEVLAMPAAAARREWTFARAWMCRELARRPSGRPE